MDGISYFRRLFEYDDWANDEVLGALGSHQDPPARAVTLLSHIAAARRLWLVRLRGESASVEVWPTRTPAGLARVFEEIKATWREHLAGLTADALHQTIEYRNTKGEAWNSKVADVLTHVAMHGAYHRGQIALELRKGGHPPPYTDFIHAVRQRYIADRG